MPDLLSPKQLAEYLQLSQRTIYRLLDRGAVPAIKVGGQWRFRKSAIDEWLDVATHRLDAASLAVLDDDANESGQASEQLADLITPGNASIRLAAGDRDGVVRAFIAHVRFPEAVSPDVVAERVLDRERICSTALAGGAALLHTRRSQPRVLRAHDLLAIARVEAPIDFGALDGTPTDMLILLLARSERDQLALLARLTRLCLEPHFLPDLRNASNGDAVVDLLHGTENRLFGHIPSRP
jgi:PTS system nitrogen regulatory IIA component